MAGGVLEYHGRASVRAGFGMRRRSGVASKRAHGQIEQRHHKIPDKLRLGMIHALQYVNTTPNNAILAVKEVMKGGGASADNVTLVDAILRYAGSRAWGPRPEAVQDE